MKNTRELILSNINLANNLAASKKRSLSHIYYEDLQSAAFLGLVEAANKFDNSKNNCFEAFAICRIQGAIKDYLRELNWGSRRNPIYMYNYDVDNSN
jgi:RNA polymerase sigma factor for flagellar operon FliA